MLNTIFDFFHGPKIYKINELKSFDETCKALPKVIVAGHDFSGYVLSNLITIAIGTALGAIKDGWGANYKWKAVGAGVGLLCGLGYNSILYKIDSYSMMKPKNLVYIQDNMIKFCVATPEIDDKDDSMFDNKYYLKYTFDVRAETNNVEIHVYD